MLNALFLVVGAIAGSAVVFIVLKGFKGLGKKNTEVLHSHTMVESIERVFKVVTAEGRFSEIFDYSHTDHVLSMIPSTKKALIIVNAHVLMGFDIKKSRMEVDDTTKKVRFAEFPAPEILSIQTELKYYNLENGLFNRFDNEDLTRLQKEAHSKISESALKSDLPSIAQKQMRTMLRELTALQDWRIEGIDSGAKPLHEIEANQKS
ncbi:MAG TPA: DUF4230 domain-containing protein [Chitinophagaceae bacterium]|nr:DUF4230 domain-containing protein [Chitinophagaceae bacterium]